MPIRSAICTASPLTSTGPPLERRSFARSTMVGRNPASARKYANVGPAIPQPEIKTELPVMSSSDLRSALTVTSCPPVSKLKGAWDDVAKAYGEAMGEGHLCHDH